MNSFIELPIEDPRHRRVITAAIESGDIIALKALQGRMDQPIHFVTNWFYYHLMMKDQEQEAVVIYSPETRADFIASKQNQDGLQPRTTRPVPPLSAAYDFLN